MARTEHTTAAKRLKRRILSPRTILGGFLFHRGKEEGKYAAETVSTSRRVIWTILFALLAGVAVWLVATALWEHANWSDLKMDEVVYELNTSLAGTGNNMIQTYLLTCVLPGAAAAAVAAVVLNLFKTPATWRKVARWGSLVCLVAVAGLLTYAFIQLEVGAYFQNKTHDSAYIEDNYVSPGDTTLTFPAQKRNLIYIYLESMESTFTDQTNGGAFQENYIPQLTQLAEENITFTGGQGGVNGGYAPAGATWTAGAMFAQISGLPLKIPIEGNGMDTQATFFPTVQTMGDILHQEGYRQALLIGSDATFGGRRLLFTEHGNYEMWDYLYAQEAGWIDPDYRVWWGYEDAKLFQFAKNQLAELAAGDEPFNLTMLTVDTHFPGGYLCQLCQDEFSAQYANVLACSSRQVYDFIAWVREQPFYENTTIVLMGDHLTMDADFCTNISADYQRKTYVTILNPAGNVSEPEAYREYTTFDLFPTTLAALGVEIEGGRLGLGVDLFSGQPTLVERDGLEKMNQELRYHSAFIDSLSGFSETVYVMQERLPKLDTGLTVEESGENVIFTIQNLERVEEDISALEVGAYITNDQGRTGLWSLTATRKSAGVYTLAVPEDQFDGHDEVILELFATVDHARLQVDRTYVCHWKTGAVEPTLEE